MTRHAWVALGAAASDATVLAICWFIARRYAYPGKGMVFFDNQDAFRDAERNKSDRRYPVSASSSTFEPLLKHYLELVKLVLTLAAASITFGKDGSSPTALVFPKTCLAGSILFGVVFIALLLHRYDEYGSDMRSYTKNWAAIINALGFATLIAFVMGYVGWAVALL